MFWVWFSGVAGVYAVDEVRLLEAVGDFGLFGGCWGMLVLVVVV